MADSLNTVFDASPEEIDRIAALDAAAQTVNGDTPPPRRAPDGAVMPYAPWQGEGAAPTAAGYPVYGSDAAAAASKRNLLEGMGELKAGASQAEAEAAEKKVIAMGPGGWADREYEKAVKRKKYWKAIRGPPPPTRSPPRPQRRKSFGLGGRKRRKTRRGGGRKRRTRRRKRSRYGGNNNLQIEDDFVKYHDFLNKRLPEGLLAPRWRPGELASHTVISPDSNRTTIKKKSSETTATTVKRQCVKHKLGGLQQFLLVILEETILILKALQERKRRKRLRGVSGKSGGLLRMRQERPKVGEGRRRRTRRRKRRGGETANNVRGHNVSDI